MPPTPAIAPLSPAQRAAGLVDIRTVVPDAVLDLRYATAHNFTGVRLYPRNARCLVRTAMAQQLARAARQLRQAGYRVVFWDCYRPHAVQVRMFRIVPNPTWVARPGTYATSHESALSVDVTLARAACLRGGSALPRCLVDMGTGFDDFTPRAYAFATSGVTAAQQEHRRVLRAAMESAGLAVYTGEWWHFDAPGALVPMPQLDVPVD